MSEDAAWAKVEEELRKQAEALVEEGPPGYRAAADGLPHNAGACPVCDKVREWRERHPGWAS